MTQGTHQYIPIGQLTPSPLNHRKFFDKTKMEELAASIRTQGVVVPILARPINGGGEFEVVAGERRFRAAKAAGLTEIPAIVRPLDDAQALELQVIENNQRADVLPMEEAEGYEALMKCTRAGAEPYTVDEIADKVGKSRSHIYGRLKLLALCEAGRKALREDKISASTALLVARIPVPKLQEKCVKEILEGGGGRYGNGDEAMSFRDAQEHIEEHYMLRLKEAPFKPADADLVPKAGACTDCPKRTGNHPELFADIASADVCTDPPCFDAKKKAFAERKREEAIADGRTVISGKDAKKIMPQEYSQPRGYVKLDAACYEDPKQRTYRALLGKAAAKPTLLEKPSAPGEFIDVLPEDEVVAALKKKGYDFTPKTAKRDEAEDAKERLQHEIDVERRMRTYLAFREVIQTKGFGAEDLRALILEEVGYEPPAQRLLVLWGAPEGDDSVDVDKLVKEAPNDQLVPMLMDSIIRDPARLTYVNGKDSALWEPLAKLRGIDAKAIEREVRAEFKAKAKENATEEAEAA